MPKTCCRACLLSAGLFFKFIISFSISFSSSHCCESVATGGTSSLDEKVLSMAIQLNASALTPRETAVATEHLQWSVLMRIRGEDSVK